ncbi:MAG: permease-like cell division protein FtsX [Bacteroidales bacterium]|nr:permease-like cell division protein FtsX [Bacteroidales bacterium]
MAGKEGKTMRRRLAGAYVSSVISISLVLTLVGFSAALVSGAGRAADYFKEQMQVSVVFSPELPDASAEAGRTAIDSLPFVRETRLVSRAEGTEELKSLLGEDFLSVFESTPVPVSVDVRLLSDYVHPDSLERVKSALEAVPGVEEVDVRFSLVEALNANLSRIALALLVLIGLLLFISFVLIGNTVRLNLYARRFTIHTMRQVGATTAFIRRPFVRQAVLQGLVAAVIALCILVGAWFLLHRSFPQLAEVFGLEQLLVSGAAVLVVGIVICALSAASVVRRIVYSDKDALYY